MPDQESLIFRPARGEELETIIAMLANDSLGATRENVGDQAAARYRDFFQLVDADPNNALMVVEGDGSIVGFFQLTFIPGITFGGSWRAQVEGVRVAESARGQGIGKAMMEWVIEQARKRDCVMVQLTSNKQRTGALEFYEKLGFVASHQGFKKMLR